MRIEAANLIDGRLVPASGGRTLDTIEPATGSAWGTLPDSDSSDVNAAVAAAERAFPGWAATPVRERSACLRRLADLVERDLDALALAESTDTGKPLALARAMDVPRAAANLRFFAGAIEHDGARIYRTDAPAPAPGQAAEAASPVAWNTVLKRPLGVVGLISPWNLPLYLLTWKIAPALACGNTAVCKPSELTPATAFMLARLTVEAGLPPGVLNIVHGPGASAGAPLVAHPSVKAVSFTGGTATGAAISASAAPRFKKLSLELGGKNAAIVFDDVDAERTAGELVRAAFSNQGQICLCASRVLVQRGVYERFVAAFVGLASALRIGDPLDAQTQQGALVSAAHRDKVESYVALARREGGSVLCGGSRASVPGRCAGGAFFQPTVVANLPMTCRTQQEEIFGPVVTVTPFEKEDHAVELANATPYGLSASVWTRDTARALRTAERLDAGTVWVNCWLVRDLRVPFGGVKQSGVGREGGDDAINFFTESRTVCVALR